MKSLIFLTLFSSSHASIICTREYFLGTDNFNPELQNSKWKIKKSAVKFSDSAQGVERIFSDLQTAFYCDYNSVESLEKVGITIKASMDDPRDCPPISFTWKSEKIISANFINNRTQGSFSYVYKFNFQKFFMIVGCEWNGLNKTEIVSAFVFVDSNNSGNQTEIDDVSFDPKNVEFLLYVNFLKVMSKK
jgi:hypothetical protein